MIKNILDEERKVLDEKLLWFENPNNTNYMSTEDIMAYDALQAEEELLNRLEEKLKKAGLI